MTKEEYLRKMARLALQMKALADNYEEGCGYFSLCTTGEYIQFGNHQDKGEDHYSFSFQAGDDIENGRILPICTDSHMYRVYETKKF